MEDIYTNLLNKGENRLSHHGILGMKWGKRNGPPYPLSSAKSAAIKKKASSGRVFGGTTASDKTKVKKSGLTDKQKRALKIGASVVATALAAYGGYKISQYAKYGKSGMAAIRESKLIRNAMISENIRTFKNELKDFNVRINNEKEKIKSIKSNARKVRRDGAMSLATDSNYERLRAKDKISTIKNTVPKLKSTASDVRWKINNNIKDLESKLRNYRRTATNTDRWGSNDTIKNLENQIRNAKNALNDFDSDYRDALRSGMSERDFWNLVINKRYI